MGIPVIGQPFSVASYMVVPVLRCNCERGGIVQLMAQQREGGWIRTQEPCPSCGKLFSVAAISVGPDGTLQLSIEMAVPMPQRELVTQ